jgi:SagB-type dehydrogenase family enzyme
VKEQIASGRAFLRPLWDEVDFDKTDQGLGRPVPEKFKPAREGAPRTDLVPRERWPSARCSVIDAILRRETRRKFALDSLALAELSLLLYCTQGVRRAAGRSSFRTVPSAGARHSFETYLYVERVDSLARGVYRYLPAESQLCLEQSYRADMAADLKKALYDQLYEGTAVCFIWTAVPYRMEWRYSTLSPKLIALDAGHVCQNLYLACEAIGAGTCAIGAYDQRAIDAFLRVDGVDEFAVYMAPVGKVAS